MAKKIHYLVVCLSDGRAIMPCQQSFGFKGWLGAICGVYEYVNSSDDEMLRVLCHICNQAGLLIDKETVVKHSSGPSDTLQRIVITVQAVGDGPKNPGYFKPLASHRDSAVLYVILGIAKSDAQVA